MKLKLPSAPGQYDPGNESGTRNLIEQADAQNVKTTTVLNYLKFRDTVTGAIKTLTIANGAVTVS